MDDVVIQTWNYLYVYGQPDGPVQRVTGHRRPPDGTAMGVYLEQLRAEDWEVRGYQDGYYTLRRRAVPFALRYRWMRADAYTERLATEKRSAGMEPLRAVQEATAEVRRSARLGTRRDAEGKTLIRVPKHEWEGDGHGEDAAVQA